MSLYLNKMCSINLPFHLKTITLTSKKYRHKVNYFNYSLARPYIHPLSKHCCTKYFYTVTNNFKFDYNSTLNISSISYLKYSTAPLEVPPEPPISTDEIKTRDIFGTLGGLKYEKVELDQEEAEEDEKQKNLLVKVPRNLKPSLGEYAKMIKNYISKGDINNAEQVMRICLDNRDKPSDYMYSLLIYALAFQGDIQKCYKYFSDMKSRKLKIKKNVYTSLFNACANSSDTTKALSYLEKIRSYMDKKKEPIGHAHYNVLIKAYGRHNQFNTAEKLVKYMIDHKLKIGISTLNSLMYAANTNTQSGLKHIFSIWQFMRQQKIPPNIFTYHLLLRAIRDIRFGDCTLNDLLTSNQNTLAFSIDKNRPDLLKNPPVISSLSLDDTKQKTPLTVNTLFEPPVLQSVLNTLNVPSDLNVSELSTNNKHIPDSIANLQLDTILEQNKLILFGGFESLLKKMENDKVKPDIKTLTYLIELVPGSLKAEELIIKHTYLNNIKPDISFFNILIKKRCLRGAKKEAKEVIDYIHKADLKPNIVTYGVLALSCISINDCYELLTTMQATNCSINKFVAQPLFAFAMQKLNFKFILFLMEKLKRERVLVDEQLFQIFDDFQQKMTKMTKTKHYFSETEKFKTGFSKFNMRYKSWQEDMGRKILTERE